MTAIILAAIASFQMIFFGKHNVPLLGKVVVIGFEFIGKSHTLRGEITEILSSINVKNNKLSAIYCTTSGNRSVSLFYLRVECQLSLIKHFCRI